MATMDSLAELIGESPGIRAVRETVGRLLARQTEARRVPPVLIQGETGTGKGLLARALHSAGPRRPGPFVDVNCAAIPETLLEAELFGFERGAFTDARQAKAGLFQTAHRGTLFLDEIALLPEPLQSKLLTVIEERAVRRLGSTKSEPVDVWIVTASNEDLAVTMRQGRFREDLYHRLAVLTVWMPPLRERGRDILLLAEHYLARACADYGLPSKTFAPDAEAALLGYPWPGNIRELTNVMERVALLAEEPVVSAAMLGLPTPPTAEPRAGMGESRRLAEDMLTRLARERDELAEALRATDWNVSRAATRLGIPRNTLRYRIERHRLQPGPAAPARRRASPPLPSPAAPPPTPAPVAAPAPGTRSAGAPPAATSLRWEQRRLTLLRAAHAAMTIQKISERARGVAPGRPGVRVGLHTAHFPVGQAAGMTEIDPDAKREAWAILAALTAGSDAETILVSAPAAALLERRFELAPAGTRAEAGGTVYRLAGLERPGLGRRLAPFVGRQDELYLLHSRLAAAMRGHGQVVGIGGDAGIGKSRLLVEFRERLAAQPILYLEAHCFSYGSAIPYLPLTAMLRQSSGITEADPPEVIVAKVRAGIEAVGMDPEAAAPYLLHLLGVKEGTGRLTELSPEAVQSRMFEILWQASLRGSQRHPLILAIEDAHWIDTASQAYLDALVESLAGAAILLILTYRPGYRTHWLAKSYATQIALPPLSPEESLGVVASVLKTSHVPPPVAQRIVDKAEGNPFFLEELARTVAEHGGQPGTAPVPDTIQEVLESRIDRLADEPRRVLQAASILGREVSLRLLRALWEGPGAPEPHLRELTRLEFLYDRPDGDEPVYVFRHALIRDVARESLALPRRQALHAAAGRALEALYADRREEVYDRLAYHYSKGKEAAKAVAYLTALAEKAAQSYAHVEATAALDEALGHVERLPAEEREHRRLDLVLRQAYSLAFLGRFRDTLDLLQREQARLESLASPALAGPYYFWLAHTHSYLGDHEPAIASAQRALEEAGRAGDVATSGKANVVLAQEHYWAGQPLHGIARGRRAVELLTEAGDRWWLGLAHWIVGINYVIVGAFDLALEAEARALAVGEALGDRRIQSYATWSTGWIHALTGAWEAGIEACKRGLGDSPDPVNTAVALGHLGYVYLEKGDAGEALPLLTEAVGRMREFAFRRLLGRFTTFLGEAHLLDGRLDEAEALVREGLRITSEADYWYGRGWAQSALGRIARTGGRLEEAQGHLNEARATFSRIHARFMMGRTALALAEVAHARGDETGAARFLQEASAIFRTLRIPRYIERADALARTLGVLLPEAAATAELAIVRRGEEELFRMLEAHLEALNLRQVMWDRRHAERRGPAQPTTPERRREDRRRAAPAGSDAVGFLLAP